MPKKSNNEVNTSKWSVEAVNLRAESLGEEGEGWGSKNRYEIVEPGEAHDREGDLSYAKSLY